MCDMRLASLQPASLSTVSHGTYDHAKDHAAFMCADSAKQTH